MSSLSIAFAPLSPDSLPDDAYNDEIALPPLTRTKGVLSFFELIVPGEYFYYPLSLACTLSTDATVGSRGLFYTIVNPNLINVYSQIAFQAQPPSATWSWSWQITNGTAYTDGNGGFTAPLPPRLLPPGYRIAMIVSLMAPGDTISGTVSLIKIPRAHAQAVPVLAPVPTPLVV